MQALENLLRSEVPHVEHDVAVHAAALAGGTRGGFVRDDQAARIDISAIKVFVPAAYTRVVDRAIQVWGAAGVSGDLPLSAMYQGARTLRLADGPDEVHKILIAKNILKHYHAAEGRG